MGTMRRHAPIGQAGYILIALAIGGAVGFVAAVVYAIINSLNKTLLFLAAGLRGPLVGLAFAVGAFSVVGVPPAGGFLGKLALFKASISAEGVVLSSVLVALVFLGGALSFLYAFQVYQRAFLAPTGFRDEAEGKSSPVAVRVLVLALATLVVAVGIWPEPLLMLADAAAAALTGGGPG